jgi:hypothetical protein
MSKQREALERALELCESISLADLQKYPQAGYLIPLLHEVLEQEEKCSHIFNDNICIGCGFALKF